MSDNGFRFGDWQIDPDSNTLRNGDTAAAVEPKAMDVLRYLCRHAGAVIPPEELLQACWGNAELGDNPIHKAITQLRRALGDSASEPRYIETVRKRGYRAIAPVIATEDALEGSWQQGSPFRGLESFQESHAAIFFGRMQATAQLRELVLRQASDGCAMALVLGPSGSGKTSLVRAGLLPGLMASRTGSGEPVALACTLYMDCADLADGNLFQALAAVLIDAEVGGQLLFAGENAEGLGRWLESSDAESIAGRFKEVSGRIKVGLFVDRLEAIFRAPGVTDEIRLRFIAVLEHLASSRAVLVMLACRNDFYPEVIALPALMALKTRGGHFDLNPPDGAEIAQMVRMPAKAAGLKFEQDPATGASLDDVLCDAARGSPDTLPLLQYCLNELYRQRGEDGSLRFDAFRQLGSIEGAIAVRAEQVVAGLSSPQAAALPHILSLIVDVAEEHGTVTARRAAWSALPNAEARGLLQALVEARLFVSELSGDVPSFGMAHEALLRRWPRMSKWIEQHRHTLQIRNLITIDADRWETAGRPRDLLLPAGTRMNQAHELLNNEMFVLSPQGREYVQRSLTRVRRAERIRLSIMTLIAILAVLAATLGLLAHRAQYEAEQRRVEAEGLMGYMLGEFVDKLRPLGKLELLDNVSARALQYLTAEKAAGADNVALTQRAKSLQVVAEVKRARGNIPDAVNALMTARRILHQLDIGPSTAAQIVKDLGTNSFWLGQLQQDMGDIAQAERYYLEYRNYSNRLADKAPDNLEAKLEQSYANNNLGSLYLKAGRLTEAANVLQIATRIKREAVLREPSKKEYAAELANSISFLATTQIKLGHLMEAMDLYKEEEKLLVPLHDTNANAQWSFRLSGALWRQGELSLALGEERSAAKQLSSAEVILSDLTRRDPENNNWRLQLLGVKIKQIETSAENPGVSLLIDIDKIVNELGQMNNSVKKRSDLSQYLAKALRVKALIHARLEDPTNARNALEQSINILQQLHGKAEASETSRVEFSLALLIQAENDRQGQQANASCTRVLEIISPISKDSSDYRLLVPHVRALYCAKSYQEADKQIEKLKKIGFKNQRFLSYISTHPRKENS